jgi:CheY-like chemotaxis protein
MPDVDAPFPPTSAEPSPKTKVLVVDDNDSILQNLTAILTHNGFAVTAAANVKQALALIGSHTFDVLVSDLHMPDPGDGLTVVSAMRHSNPRAVTLILSAFPEMKQATAAILRQADAVLVKPLPAQELVKSIREHLKLRPPPAPALQSVADIIECASQSIIEDWLESVRSQPNLASIAIDDNERCEHLPQLFRDMVVRLRFPLPLGSQAVVSDTARRLGDSRRRRGYSAQMLVEELRLLQISIFNALQDNLPRIDFSVLLVGVMTVADEIDSQLGQQLASYISAGTAPQSPRLPHPAKFL